MWRKINAKGNEPCQRRRHAAVVYQNKMYIFGGNTYRSLLNDMYAFHLGDFVWEKIEQNGDIPSLRCGHSMVVSNRDSMFLWGGGGYEFSRSSNDLYEFHFRTNVWIKHECKGTTPSIRHIHVMVYDKKFDKIYIFGGGNAFDANDDLHELDVMTLTWNELPSCDYGSRVAHSAAFWEGSLFVFGGLGKVGRFNHILKYDTITQQWSILNVTGELPSERAGNTLVLHQHYLIVHGGFNGRDDLNDTYVFNLKKNEWRKLDCVGEIPSARCLNTAVISKDGKMYLFGGLVKSKKETNNEVIIFNEIYELDIGCHPILAQLHHTLLKKSFIDVHLYFQNKR